VSDETAVALRREWEQWKAARDAETELRHHAETVARDRFEAAGTETRIKLTEELGELLEALKPYVDGTMGEVTAAMVSVYVKAAHEMAGLWGLHRPLRDPVALPVRPEPPAVEDPVAVEARRVEAVAAARDEILVQLSAVKAKMIEAS